jgi:N-acetylmuramoyl-L-alanine amidase
MKLCLLITALLLQTALLAQKPELKLVTPTGLTPTVNTARQFITGTTCPGCTLTVNDSAVKVFSTGAFAYRANLKEGANFFFVKSDNGSKTAELTIQYVFTPPAAPRATDSFYFENISIEPAGNLALPPGESIRIRVKTKPGAVVKLNDKYMLAELPASETGGLPGIYQMQYVFTEKDSLVVSKLQFSLYNNGAKKAEAQSKHLYTVLNPAQIQVGKTTGPYTPVYTGLGEDRLGGAKAGFLDSAVRVHITGRIDDLYRVRLNPSLSTYIPMSSVSPLPAGTAPPRSLTQNIRASGDSTYDYVQVELFQKLPYLSYYEINPTTLVLDVYGATSNTNWLVQYPETMKEVADVYYRQVEDDLLRVTIRLKHTQQWGYKVYYTGNTLTIRIKRPPPVLQLSGLTIAVDAGHGGSNTGARGIAGRYEKEFTLEVAKKLKALLVAEGVTVIMTRESDISFENNDRLKMLHQKSPHLAISIHLNSAGDPLRVKGTSIYYKSIGFKNLAGNIYKRMTETGLPGWGLIGNFNFFLNSTTEFPTALVETLFLSSPEEEEKIYRADFQQQMAEKIVQGIKDWLKECAAGE